MRESSQRMVPANDFSRKQRFTEGFHTKVEFLQRQAYAFRNSQNHRMRVKGLFS
jgi:hypothetical protein